MGAGFQNCGSVLFVVRLETHTQRTLHSLSCRFPVSRSQDYSNHTYPYTYAEALPVSNCHWTLYKHDI